MVARIHYRNFAPFLIIIFNLLLSQSCTLFDEDDPIEGHLLSMLDRINDARNQARTCGSLDRTATSKVKWNEKLADAALRLAKDVAKNNGFGHTGSDGSSPGSRISDTGYRAIYTGEILAIFAEDSDDAMKGWFDSAGHCNVMMSGQFTEMGAAVAGGHVYVVSFATPSE